MVAPIAGHKCKLYRNTGVPATPVWSEIDEVGDVELGGMEMGGAELKRRNNDFTKELSTLMGVIEISANLIYGLDATNFDAIRANFFNGTVEQYAVMNGDITTTGNEGLKIPVRVATFPWAQPLEEATSFAATFRCAYMDSGGEVDPAWYTVPA